MITVIKEEEGISLVKKMFDESVNKEIYMDTETNGLDPYINDILLLILYNNKDNSYILDTTSVNVSSFFPEDVDNYLYVGHNIKFDCKMLYANNDVLLLKTWDTMLAIQKYYQGNLFNKIKNPLGVKVNLKDTIEKILNIGSNMDKDIRNTFIGINPNKFIANDNQIIYADKDVRYLPDLKNKLTKMLEIKRIFYLDLYGQYIPMSTGLMELNGIRINKEQWMKTVKENEIRKFEIECLLDEEFRALRFALKDNQVLLGGKYDKKRIYQEPIKQESLFDLSEFTINKDKLKKEKVKISDANINWKSTTQIVRIFALLEERLPIDHKTVSSAIPLYTVKKNSKTGKDKIIIISDYKFTTKADNIKEMLNENPKIITKKFFELLMEYREINTALDTFGKSFLDKINPKTGKLHSIFRTDNTTTGRYQSGEKDTMYPNFQNIPRKEAYRTSFTASAYDRSIGTLDLSGAEVTIMCDKANDKQLYEWAVKNDDAHSPIATASWQNIYIYRLAKELNIVDGPNKFMKEYNNIVKSLENEEKFKEILKFKITKKENKEYRQTFKNLTFAAVYNVGKSKAAKILNVNAEEATIALWTIKSKIPDTFKFVEEQSKIAMETGTVLINKRIGSRIIFPEVIRWKLQGKSMEDFNFMDRINIEGAARNVVIQGTQADMLKEALVEITLYILKNKVDCKIINKVHDEIVVDFHDRYLKEENKHIWVSDKIKEKINPKKYSAISSGEKPFFFPLDKREMEIVKIEHIGDEENVKVVLLPEFIRLTMITAASRYLTHYKMGSSCEVAKTWVK